MTRNLVEIQANLWHGISDTELTRHLTNVTELPIFILMDKISPYGRCLIGLQGIQKWRGEPRPSPQVPIVPCHIDYRVPWNRGLKTWYWSIFGQAQRQTNLINTNKIYFLHFQIHINLIRRDLCFITGCISRWDTRRLQAWQPSPRRPLVTSRTAVVEAVWTWQNKRWLQHPPVYAVPRLARSVIILRRCHCSPSPR